MNPNLNRHRSPTQRTPPPLTINNIANYNLNNHNVIRSQKAQMHSSTQESSKDEHYSHEQANISKQIDQNPQSPISFFKIKKQEPYIAKPQPSFLYLKNNNSEKAFKYTNEIKMQYKIKNSPEKYSDYFGFKAGHKAKEKKLSQSGDSQISQHSTHSNNVENGAKNFKFFSKKLDKKFSEQHLLKLSSKPSFQQSKELIQKKQVLYFQQKKQLNKKCSLQSFVIKKQPQYNQYSPRKKSPPNNPGYSPSKKQQVILTGSDNAIYKRSSLTPQNKLQVTKPSHNYDPPKNTLTPKKKNSQKQYTPPKTSNKIPQNYSNYTTHKASNQQEKMIKLTSFYPNQNKDKKKTSGNSIDFSFSKQRSQKNIQQNQGYRKVNNNGSYYLNPKLSPRSLPLAPSIIIYPLNYQPNNYVTFIVLQKLAQNKSSTIFKCLHPQTKMIYCLKKCAVDNYNIDQLIVQHKISTSLIHPNLVRGYGTFYDQNYLYLLMQFMDGKSLLNRNQNLPFIPKANQYQLSISQSKTPTSDPKINRFSFKQTMYDHQFQNQYQNQQRHSNLHTYSMSYDKTNQKIDKLYFIKNVLEQILQGLRFLHQNNIMHRDLKPDNIFVSHICFKIGDFGSCSYTNSQQYIGTLDYAAPEIMLRQKYDKSIDLWSLGCIAYELDVGKPPFYHYDRNQTIRRIVNVEYDQQKISHPNLKDFIGKLLVKNGNLRISTSEALMELRMIQFAHGSDYIIQDSMNKTPNFSYISYGNSSSSPNLLSNQHISKPNSNISQNQLYSQNSGQGTYSSSSGRQRISGR